MGAVRNRVLSGHKAASTNKSKRSDFYQWAGGFGGLVGGRIRGIRKGFAALDINDRRSISQKGVKARRVRRINDYFTYLVVPRSPAQKRFTRELSTRWSARIYKRDNELDAKIFQQHFKNGVLIASREVR